MHEGKVEDEREDYNPFEHRKVKKPSSDLRSTTNLIKASLGSGLLAGPLAFANAGWGVGIVGTIVIGIICGHCVHILVKTSRGCCKLERKPLLGYAETAESAFANGPKPLRPYANWAKIFSEFALVATYVGVCCIYTVLISDSIKQLVDKYFPSVILPVEYYCVIILVPICLLCQVRYLKWLAIFSFLANLFLVATYVICLYYIFGEKITLADKRIAGDPWRFPAFVSTVICAMEGIGVVMPIENAMKKPQHFLGCPSVLVVAMTAIVFFYSTLGLFGYFRYGDVLRGSITLNLSLDDCRNRNRATFIGTNYKHRWCLFLLYSWIHYPCSSGDCIQMAKPWQVQVGVMEKSANNFIWSWKLNIRLHGHNIRYNKYIKQKN